MLVGTLAILRAGCLASWDGDEMRAGCLARWDGDDMRVGN